jgi:hypothetical protein
VCATDGLSYGACDCAAADGGGGGDAETEASTDARTEDALNEASLGDVTKDADNDAGPLSPGMLPGLVLWLDDTVGIIADPAVPGGVKRWLDQSPEGNDATQQNTPDPMLDPSALNGHDIVLCPGNGGYFIAADDASLRFGTGDFMIAMVVRVQVPGGPTQGPILWAKGDVPNVRLDATALSDFRVNVGGQMVTVPNPNTAKFHIVIARGPNVSLRVDGVSASGGMSTSDVSQPGPGVLLCSAVTSTSNDTSLAEAIAVKGAVSTADVIRLESYLKTKFKL